MFYCDLLDFFVLEFSGKFFKGSLEEILGKYSWHVLWHFENKHNVLLLVWYIITCAKTVFRQIYILRHWRASISRSVYFHEINYAWSHILVDVYFLK